MKYLCNDMRYLRDLCFDTLHTYEKTLNNLLKEYKNEQETDIVALCVDITDTFESYDCVETLYCMAKTNSNILLRERTFLLLHISNKFDKNKFSAIREEDDW